MCFTRVMTTNRVNEAEDGFDEEMEPIPRAFCDRYEVHVPHVYLAINGNHYDCPGFTAGDLADLETAEVNAETCEHGLAMELCSGDQHWGSYDDERRREGY